MRINRVILARHILFLVAITAFISCATTTKPNTSAKINSSTLNDLAKKNPLLVKELKKIPEIQDGISKSEEVALNKLVQIYDNNSIAFNNAFKQMYGVGIPEVRKYCTPLQALFWLAKDGKPFGDIIENYSLKGLIGRAWTDKDAWKTAFSRDEWEQIKKGLVGPLASQHRVYLRQYDEASVMWVVESFNGLNERKKYFSWPTRRLVKNAIERSKEKNSRWANFHTVADRLNAPYLVHQYIVKFIKYKTISGITYSPKTVHERGWGDSDDLAKFGMVVLAKSGYKTFWEEAGNRDVVYHPGSGVILDDGSYLLVVDFGRSGNTYGNWFTSKSQIIKQLELKIR